MLALPMLDDKVKQNTEIEITFSDTEKMPWISWDLPARRCKTGAKLVKVKGSICHGCYALKGRYLFGNKKKADDKRIGQLDNLEEWQEAFVKALAKKYKHMRDKSKAFFRWFTSGDLQSLSMLVAMNEIALALPEIKFWLPTKEHGFVREYQALYGEFADNFTVRPSMFMVDQIPSKGLGLPTSTVVSSPINADDLHGNICPASLRAYNGAIKVNCDDCRKCWDKEISNVSYIYH